MTDETVTGRTMRLIRNEIIEECAKLCDGLRRKDYSTENDDWAAGTSDCAAAIRALARLDFSTAGTSHISAARQALAISQADPGGPPPLAREKLVDLADRLDCIGSTNIDEADTLNEAAEVIRSISNS